MNRAEKFHALHVKGDPLILFNIWDAGSARAVADAGAKAIATGSWSVAAAFGYDDGEQIPLDLVLANIERITKLIDLPVTLDFEGGYSVEPQDIGVNTRKVLDAGVVGVNFEDQVVGGEGLHSVEIQSERISAMRSAAEVHGTNLFINARTDVFLKATPESHDSDMLEEVLARAEAYRAAGSSGLFVPGLRDNGLIAELCKRSRMPVNLMAVPDGPTEKELAGLGAARISHGPYPYRRMLEWLKDAAKAAFSAA